VVRIITNQNCDDLLVALKNGNHGITVVDAQGSIGPVKMVFTIIQRKNVQAVVKLIRQYNPTAFYSVEEIKDTSQGVFKTDSSSGLSAVKNIFSSQK